MSVLIWVLYGFSSVDDERTNDRCARETLHVKTTGDPWTWTMGSVDSRKSPTHTPSSLDEGHRRVDALDDGSG